MICRSSAVIHAGTHPIGRQGRWPAQKKMNPTPCWPLCFVKWSVQVFVIHLVMYNRAESRGYGLTNQDSMHYLVSVLWWGDCMASRWELAGVQLLGSMGRAKLHLSVCICVHCPAKTLALSRTLSPKCLKVPHNYNYLALLDNTAWGCHRKWNLGICPSHKNV